MIASVTVNLKPVKSMWFSQASQGESQFLLCELSHESGHTLVSLTRVAKKVWKKADLKNVKDPTN